MGKPLVKITLLFILGLILSKYVPSLRRDAIDLLKVSLLITLILFLLRQNLPRLTTRYLLLAGVGLLIVTSGIFWYSWLPLISSSNIGHFLSPQPVEVTGIIKNEPVFQRHSARFVLKCQRLGQAGQSRKVSGLLQVIFHGQVNEVEPILRCGYQYRFKVYQ